MVCERGVFLLGHHRALIENIAILEEDRMGLETSLGIAEGHVLKEEDTPVEITIVMPCLNEAETLGICIEKAKRALSENSIQVRYLLQTTAALMDRKELQYVWEHGS